MTNRVHLKTSCAVAFVLMLGWPASVWADLMPEQAQRELKERLAASRIRLTPDWRVGKVSEPGTVLVLLRDHVPARAFHTLSQQKPYPRVWHLDDYGRVEIAEGTAIVKTPEQKAFAYLERGQVLVILDHKFKGRTIELWTHTLNRVAPKEADRQDSDPQRAPTEQNLQHASTKFVFHFSEDVLRSGDVAGIEKQIEEWLKPFESVWEAEEFSRNLSGRR
ncbi:MAG: hypothetical protein AB1898_07575 [Acidobacteriota bacterium]